MTLILDKQGKNHNSEKMINQQYLLKIKLGINIKTLMEIALYKF